MDNKIIFIKVIILFLSPVFGVFSTGGFKDSLFVGSSGSPTLSLGSVST